MKGWVEKSFWWDDPTVTDRHYVDSNGVRWVVQVTLPPGGSGWVDWRARPETEAARYKVAAGRWPVSAKTAYRAYRPGLPGTAARRQHDAYVRKELEFFGGSIDEFVGKRSGLGGFWVVILIALALRRKKGR